MHRGRLWWRTDKAMDVTERAIEDAARAGRLRGILDAVQTNRLEDDSSPCRSFARKHFGRRLCRTRRRLRVTLVEAGGDHWVYPARNRTSSGLHWAALWDQGRGLAEVRRSPRSCICSSLNR